MWNGRRRPVRILLVGMSKMLSNIIAASLSHSPNISVVGTIDRGEDMFGAIRLTSADAVIVKDDQPSAPEVFTALLRSLPTLKVLAIDETGKIGCLHRLCHSSIQIPELSVSALQSALLGDYPEQ